MTRLWKNQAFTISHADGDKFAGQGLRPFFEYRDLGIHTATQGAYAAHVIRAVPGMESPGTWHVHDLDFQMVFVTKGWVVSLLPSFFRVVIQSRRLPTANRSRQSSRRWATCVLLRATQPS